MCNSFIEENHAYRMESQKEQAAQPWRGPIPQEKMSFWGYKFETLATLPAPWSETTREYIESRVDETVNNEAQYCSVVRTGVGKTILCLGGEVDASKSTILSVPPLTHLDPPPPFSGLRSTLTDTTHSLGFQARAARRAHQLGRT